MLYTNEEILAIAAQCVQRNDIHTKFAKYYHAAARRGILHELYAKLPAHVGHVTVYSDDELAADAKRFKTRKAWKDAGDQEVAAGASSHHRVAFKRGGDFYRLCCAHMPDLRGKKRCYTYSDAQLLASSRKYMTRGEWKKKAHRFCETARNRPIWDECVAHMRPAANPYAKDYLVYVYEFTDHFCYVGLTFVPENRQATHKCRGPVFRHVKICPTYDYKVLISGLSYVEVRSAEAQWQDYYKSNSWQALHTAKPGSLGGIRISKWTKESILEEARKYTTRQAWIDGSQFTYRLAKREGWFAEAIVHMLPPRKGVRLGMKASPETKQKQREAKLGRPWTQAQRLAHCQSDRILALLSHTEYSR